MANLEGDLKAINTPGSIEYRPDPNSYMSLEILRENRAFLVERLAVWEWRKSDSKGRNKWEKNAQKGIDMMKEKIAKYDKAIQDLLSAVSPVLTDTPVVTGAGSTEIVSLPSGTQSGSEATPVATDHTSSTAGSTQPGGLPAAGGSIANPSTQGFFDKHKKKIFIGAGVLLAAVVVLIVIKRRQ